MLKSRTITMKNTGKKNPSAAYFSSKSKRLYFGNISLYTAKVQLSFETDIIIKKKKYKKPHRLRTTS